LFFNLIKTQEGSPNNKQVHAREVRKDDPFSINKAAEYQFIEFSPLKYDERFSCFIRKIDRDQRISGMITNAVRAILLLLVLSSSAFAADIPAFYRLNYPPADMKITK
jgi:hypothetical protein